MVASVVWLGTYLLIGAAAVWVCYNTRSCLVRSRAERNSRIVSALASPAQPPLRRAETAVPAPVAPAIRR